MRTYVPEFSGNVYFRTFQVSNPKALLEMSRRHGTTRSKRILGPLKKISAEEQRIADEIKNAAASVAQKMQDLEQIQHDADNASRPTTATKPEGGGKKKKKGKKTPKATPKGSRPGSPEKRAKKKGKKKGKKKSKSGGSKNTTPANSRPGTSNGGGEGEGGGNGNAASGGAGTVGEQCCGCVVWYSLSAIAAFPAPSSTISLAWSISCHSALLDRSCAQPLHSVWVDGPESAWLALAGPAFAIVRSFFSDCCCFRLSTTLRLST